MASDANATVDHGHSFKGQSTIARHQKQPSLFPTEGMLEVLELDILSSLSKTKSHNQHLMGLPDRCAKLTRSSSVDTATLRGASTVFVDNQVIQQGIPAYLLIDNRL